MLKSFIESGLVFVSNLHKASHLHEIVSRSLGMININTRAPCCVALHSPKNSDKKISDCALIYNLWNHGRETHKL